MKQKFRQNKGKNRILALAMSLMLFQGPLSYAQESASTINYTDSLFEVTESGVYDPKGNIVDPNQLPILEAPAISADEFSLSLNSSTSSNPPSQKNFSQYQANLLQNWANQTQFASSQLGGVQQDMQAQESRFKELEEVIHNTQQELEPIEHEIETLENQLNLYNGQIEQLKEKTRRVENLIAEKRTYLRELMLQLGEINTEFELLKGVARDFIRLLHDQGSSFTDTEDKATEDLKLLLGEGTVNEQLVESSYLETMEETGRQVFHQLEKKREEAQKKGKQVEQEQLELNYLLDTLNQERMTLEQVRLSKTQLLEVTQGKQEEYLRMLKEAEEEQKQLEYELSTMGDIETLLRQQLAILQQGLNQVQGAQNEGDLLNLTNVPNVRLNPGASSGSQQFQIDPKLLALLEEDLAGSTKKLGLSWPVKPNKVTATFSDSSYIDTFGVAHNATDIRAPQGSNVYAAAPGMVVKVVPPTSTKYAYVVIAHSASSLPPEYNGKSTGLTTLYGHVSRVDVKVGQMVNRGQVIGASGATPGSLGAGLRTTGAHMHFEVRDGGKLVDALQYLILTGVNDDYLPAGFKSTDRDRKYWAKGQ